MPAGCAGGVLLTLNCRSGDLLRCRARNKNGVIIGGVFAAFAFWSVLDRREHGTDRAWSTTSVKNFSMY